MATVSRVTEISAVSEISFDDAVRAGIARAAETLRGLQSVDVTRQQVEIGPDGKPTGFRVDMLVRFVLDGHYAGEMAPYPNPATQTADFAPFQE
jgi:flavin-binding protein dodecin